MESPTLEWAKIEKLLREMIQEQQAKVYAVGRRIVPTLTAEDLLQPNDYPALAMRSVSSKSSPCINK